MTRNGKIARLPKAVRQALNQRLDDGHLGVRLVEWLNALPEVQALLAEQFDGRAINEVNLTEWKAGGFLDWQARLEMRVDALELAEEAADLKAALSGSLTEHLGVIVAGRYAQLLNQWNGEVDEGFMKKLKALRMLSHDVAVQRRGEVAAGHQVVRVERLALDREKFVEQNKDAEGKALELCLKEAEKYPEVKDGFQALFVMHREYDAGKRDGSEYERQQRVKAAAEERSRKAQEERRVHTARAKSAEQRRQWMEAHPGEEVDRSDTWRNWKIDESKRLKDPALMPAKALYAGAPVDWSKVDGWTTQAVATQAVGAPFGHQKANENAKIKPN